VVEAVMTDHDPLTVTLSRAVPLSQPDTAFSRLENAVVKITDKNEEQTTLTSEEPGQYFADVLVQPGATYTLSVELEDENTVAFAQAAIAAAKIDSLTFVRQDTLTGKLTCHFQLPPERPFYARLKVSVDGLLLPDIILYETPLASSSSVQEEIDLYYAPLGGVVKVDLLTLTKPAYEFYRALRTNATTGTFNTAQAKNLPTNLSNGTLGFFTVALADTTSILLD
jgi:hypothetical protein